ncbi:TPA: hypothetical protein ACH3X3_006103 [Trebouxia sp. C0006]
MAPELHRSFDFNQENGMKALKREIRLFEEQYPSERKLACQFMRGCLQEYAKDRFKLSTLLSHKWFEDTPSITTDSIPIPDGFMGYNASKTPDVHEQRSQTRIAGEITQHDDDGDLIHSTESMEISPVKMQVSERLQAAQHINVLEVQQQVADFDRDIAALRVNKVCLLQSLISK